MAFSGWCASISVLVNLILIGFIMKNTSFMSFKMQLSTEGSWIKQDRVNVSQSSRIRREVSDNEKFEVPCAQFQKRYLRDLLGPAFNPRYMSVERPKDFYSNESMEEERMDPLPMHVREDYIRELREYQDVVDQFRSTITQAEATSALPPVKRNSRLKRFLPRNAIVDLKTGKTPWTCPWYIHWVDMGLDTFPRFMRSVTCSTATCWFGRLTCRPKAFVVVILRRKRTRCWADDEQIEQLFPMREVRGESKLPPELKEEWVFEERAANFCCECILEAPEK